jgi:hypothetical protein
MGKIISLFVLFFSTSIFAQGQTTPYYADLSDPNDLSPALIGGSVADPADWPASPWIGNCSSTLIGNKVLKTAAHCVGNGGSKSFTINNTRYTATCTHNPSYRGNSTADWALCLVSQPVVGIKFESIATEEEAACARGVKYLWTGYGCQRRGGTIDGKFRIGMVSTTQCPSGTNYDTVTRGSVALCSGDSGGGGYVVFQNGDRKVVGTNSRSNTTDTSYVSSTYTAKFRDWAKSWAASKNVSICGIDADAENCRVSGGNPDPDPDPKDCSSELSAAMSSLSSHVASQNLLKSCLSK